MLCVCVCAGGAGGSWKSDLCTSEKRWYQKEKDDYLEILNQHISQKSSNLVTTGTFNRTMIIIIAEKL